MIGKVSLPLTKKEFDKKLNKRNDLVVEKPLTKEEIRIKKIRKRYGNKNKSEKVLGSCYFHISNSGLTFSIIEIVRYDGYRKIQLKISGSAFGHQLCGVCLDVTKKGLKKLSEMINNSLKKIKEVDDKWGLFARVDDKY